MLVIVTRPAAQAAVWVEALQALGQPAQALPLIEIGPADDAAPLRQAWQGLAGCALVMFVSANAVQAFFAHAEGAAWPAGLRAGATGPGTAGVSVTVNGLLSVSPPASVTLTVTAASPGATPAVGQVSALPVSVIPAGPDTSAKVSVSPASGSVA